MQKLPQDLKSRLTPLQYRVTQEGKTQDPYTNQYYKCQKEGLYECVVCRVQLFTSQSKYNSESGWPAFYDEIPQANINRITDKSKGRPKTELRCGNCQSHLGHLFTDGPKDKTGNRYCVNSCALSFVEK